MTRTRRDESVQTSRKPRHAAHRRGGRANLLGNFEVLESRSYLAAHIAGDPTVYATIQAAVNAAVAGATIDVDAGTYAELVTINKTLTLRGAQAGQDARTNTRKSASETIVTGTTVTDGRTSAFYVNANDVTIDGFTVDGNTSNVKYGAGIVIAPNRNGAKIFNNIIQNNVSGLFLSNNSATNPAIIRNNVFRNNNNPGENGGRGIYTDGTISGGKLTNVTIDANVFYGNRGGAGSSTYESGIGIEGRVAAAGSQTNIRITNNTFDLNGKAVMAWNASGITITGNVITRQLDQWSGALRFEGGTSNVTIQNNNAYDNTGPVIRIDSKAWGDTNYGFTVTNNNFYGNSSLWTNKEAIVVAAAGQYEGPIDLRNNWWGSNTGPGGVSIGTGDVITANGNNVLWSPFLTAPAFDRQSPYWGARAGDGAPIEIEDFDHGGEGVAYHDLDVANNGKQYRPGEGVDLTVVTDAGGGYQASGVKAGEWLAYSVNLSQTAAYDIAFRVANGQTVPISFHLEVDGVNVTGAITVNPTSGAWQTVTRAGVNLTAGAHLLKLVFDTGGSTGTAGSFNWFQLTAAGVSPLPNAPSALTAAAQGSAAVKLTWRDNSTNETGFVIERKTGAAGTWQTLATVGVDVTDYTDSTVAAATTYVYRVRATGAAGDSANSFEASATTDSALPTTYLSDLPWASATNGWGPIEKDLSNGGINAGDGGVITLNGVTYSKGLGVHAGSDITYNLNGNYSTFLSDVGLDDEEVNDGSVSFQVYLDGVKVFDSGAMTPLTPTKSINLNVSGVRTLRLVTTDAGDGADYDHGDWAGARVTTSAPTLAAPTNLAITATAPTQIKLAWVDNAIGETGYKVERSTDGGATFTQIALVADGATSYIDTSVSASTSYSYRVRAAGSTGDSDYSNVATFTAPAVTGVTYLSDIQWESATNGWGPVERDMTVGGQAAGDGQTLKLNGVTYIKGLGTHASSEIVYKLNGSYGQFLSDIGVDDKQTVNGSVRFKVYADGTLVYDSGVMGANSATQKIALSVTGVQTLRLVVEDGGDGNNYDHADWADARLLPSATTLPAPTNLATTALAPTQVKLTWTDTAVGESGYKIERSTDGGATYTQIALLGTDATSYIDTSASVSSTYSYRVRATGSTGDSDYSNVATLTTPAATGATYLSDMQWESATNGWGPVERDMSVGGAGAGDGLTLKLNGVSYTKGLGTNSVSEIVYKLNGSYSQFLTDVGVDDKQTVNGSVQFKIYADGVKVFDSGIMGPNSATQQVAINVTGVNVLRLVVDDGDDGSNFDHADWANARLAPAAPSAPSGVTATAADQTVNLNWTAATGTVDSYQIERSTVGTTFTLLTTVAGSVSVYADGATTAGTTYSYRIAAINAGGMSAYSAIAQATTAAAPVQTMSPLLAGPSTASNTTTRSTTTSTLPLPSGWTSSDIGTATGGTASYSDGAYLLSGSGTDIGGTADSFQFAYRQLSGDGTIVAHLANIQSSDPTAKAGLMIRNGLGTGAKQASVLVSPNGKANLISRAKDGAASKVVAKKVATPTWLKLLRKGKKVTAFTSTDGKKWKSLGAMTVAMDKTVYVGLAVTAHQPNVATTAIDKVTVG